MMELKPATRGCIYTGSGLDAADVASLDKKKEQIHQGTLLWKKLAMASDLWKVATPSVMSPCAGGVFTL